MFRRVHQVAAPGTKSAVSDCILFDYKRFQIAEMTFTITQGHWLLRPLLFVKCIAWYIVLSKLSRWEQIGTGRSMYVPFMAGCVCLYVIVDEDWLTPCSDRSTGSCTSPASWCGSRDTHLSVASANGVHPPAGRQMTSPALQRTTGRCCNDVMKPMLHGVTKAGGTTACNECGCISGLNSTLFACIRTFNGAYS